MHAAISLLPSQSMSLPSRHSTTTQPVNRTTSQLSGQIVSGIQIQSSRHRLRLLCCLRSSYLSLQVVPTTTQVLISLIYLVGRFVHPSHAYTSRPRTYHQIHTRRDLHLSVPRNEKQTFSIPSQRPGRAPHQVAASLGISRSTILAAPLPPYHTSPSHDIQVHR